MKTQPYFFVIFLGLLLLAPVTAITVSSPVLKWSEINVVGEVSHNYIVSSQNATVEFSDNLENICNSTTYKNNITITCSPDEGVYGHIRFSESLTGGETLNTGVLLPIALSLNETPMVESIEPTITQTLPTTTTQRTPTPPTKPTPKVTYTPLSLWVSLAGLGLIPLIRRMKK